MKYEIELTDNMVFRDDYDLAECEHELNTLLVSGDSNFGDVFAKLAPGDHLWLGNKVYKLDQRIWNFQNATLVYFFSLTHIKRKEASSEN